MEVTPLDFRGVYVSSGEGAGAKPHGRDTSPPTTSASAATTDAYSAAAIAARSAPIPKKYPLDVVTQRVATNLMCMDPGMDPADAQRIAALLIGDSEPPVEDDAKAQPASAETTGTTVDFSA